MKKANENKKATAKTVTTVNGATVIKNPVKQEKAIGKTRKVFGSGLWCCAVMNGESSISAEELKKFDETITIKNLRDLADKVYADVATVATLREISANSEKEEDKENLAIAVTNARKSLGAWFKTMGKRTKDGKDKPLYSVCDADFVLLGEMCADARKMSETVAQLADKFFEMLVIETGRLVDGKPLARLSDADLKKAKKALNDERKKKAAETRKKNEEKAAEEEKAQAEQAEKLEQAENVLAQVQSALDFVNSAIEKIMAQDIPETAKTAIIADLNNALALLK